MQGNRSSRGGFMLREPQRLRRTKRSRPLRGRQAARPAGQIRITRLADPQAVVTAADKTPAAPRNRPGLPAMRSRRLTTCEHHQPIQEANTVDITEITAEFILGPIPRPEMSPEEFCALRGRKIKEARCGHEHIFTAVDRLLFSDGILYFNPIRFEQHNSKTLKSLREKT